MDKTYTQADIDALIAQNVEESINLEFKRGDALSKNDIERVKSDIGKDISAFANSDGGILIYGIEEKDHKASCLKFVDGNDFTKERLELIIHSRIQRKIEGLIIDPIRYDGKIDQTIYVVKIPRSLDAPHMTSDKKFYKRYNFRAAEMEEYEIRNSYNRQEKTQLKILFPDVKFTPRRDLSSVYCQVLIQFNIQNIGQSIEKTYKTELHVNHISFNNGSNTYYNDNFRKNNLWRLEDRQIIFSIYDPSPLFQGEIKTTSPISLKIEQSSLNDYVILKLFYSNGLEQRTFKIQDIFTEYNCDINSIFNTNTALG